MNIAATIMFVPMIFLSILGQAWPASLEDYLARSGRLIHRKEYRQARTILQKGAVDLDVGGEKAAALELWMNIGATYYLEKNLPEALRVFDDVRKRRLALLGAAHEHTRMVYQNQVQVYMDMQRADEAASLLQDYEKRLSVVPDATEGRLWALDWVKEIQQGQQHYDAAFATNQKLRDLTLLAAPDRSTVPYLTLILNASALLEQLGRRAEARELLERALAAAAGNDANAELLAGMRQNLSEFYRAAGRLSDCVAVLTDALNDLAGRGKIDTDNGLDVLYMLSRQYADRQDPGLAETLADKAIEIINKRNALPQEDIRFLRSYAVLGSVFSSEGNADAAIAALEFAYQEHASKTRQVDDDIVDFGFRLLDAYGRAGLDRQALDFATTLQRQITFRDDNPYVARLQTARCVADRRLSNLVVALAECEKAATILRALSPTDTGVVRTSLQLALTYRQAGNAPRALAIAVQALGALPPASFADLTLRGDERQLIEVALSVLPFDRPLSDQEALAADSILRAAQLVRATADDDKMAELQAIRSSSRSDDDRRNALRTAYLLSRLDHARRRALALSLSSEAFIAKHPDIRAGLDEEIATVLAQLSAVPKASGEPPAATSLPQRTLTEVKTALKADQALIVYQLFNDDGFALFVGPRDIVAHRIGMGAAELAQLVARVRPAEGSSMLQPAQRAGPLQGYDPASAYKLYQMLIEPLAGRITGARTILLLPDGAVSQLSFPLLLTGLPDRPAASADDVRQLPFLALQPYAFAMLPGLWPFARSEGPLAQKARFFIGVGDPHIAGCSSDTSTVLMDATSEAVDPATLGCEFRSLPDTHTELQGIADLFAEPDRMVMSGPTATEDRLRDINERGVLHKASLLLFSTHGLAPGELQMYTDPARISLSDNVGVPTIGDEASLGVIRRSTTLDEKILKQLEGSLIFNWYRRDVPDLRFTFPPGLLLSSPPPSSGHNIRSEADGFLSSAEITALDIDADLVILSACNTAIREPDRSSAILTGLTDAFLVAGAKSVIATEWAVASRATAEISVSIARSEIGSPARGTAMALHDAMQEALRTFADPHPFLWAPFVFVTGDARVP